MRVYLKSGSSFRVNRLQGKALSRKLMDEGDEKIMATYNNGKLFAFFVRSNQIEAIK